MALAYVDYSQQEFGIAAALSNDKAMQEAYQSGDPHTSRLLNSRGPCLMMQLQKPIPRKEHNLKHVPWVLFTGLGPKAWRRSSTSRLKLGGNYYVITGTVTRIFGSGAMILLQQRF